MAELEFKIGTLALIGSKDVVSGKVDYSNVYSYGNLNFTEFDFLSGDYHCWLEDTEGNVYDCIQNGWTKKVVSPLPIGKRFERMSKESLKTIGIMYFPSDESACQKYYTKIMTFKIFQLIFTR